MSDEGMASSILNLKYKASDMTRSYVMLATTIIILLGLQKGVRAADTIDIASYAHSQQLVAVEDGRRLNLFCLGTGAPVVVLDAGTGGDSADWRHVQGIIAHTTRTCSYDRAGYGFSDPGRRPMDASDSVDDLHRLIAAAALGRPIILVGHSIGGLYATLFAQRYADDVAGMVLIDPAFWGSDNPYLYGYPKAHAAEAMAGQRDAVRGTEHCLELARQHDVSAMRANRPSCLDDPPNPDPILHQVLDRQEATLSYYEANHSEFASEFPVDGNFSVDDQELGTGNPHLGSMPLVVLSRGLYLLPFADFSKKESDLFAKVWRDGHRRLAAASTRGQEILVVGSGHYIQNDKPEIVARSISSVLSAVRDNGLSHK